MLRSLHRPHCMTQIQAANPVSRALFNTAYRYKQAALRQGDLSGGRLGPFWDRLVFSKIKARVGGEPFRFGTARLLLHHEQQSRSCAAPLYFSCCCLASRRRVGGASTVCMYVCMRHVRPCCGPTVMLPSSLAGVSWHPVCACVHPGCTCACWARLCVCVCVQGRCGC
jgi:hypothetical protein